MSVNDESSPPPPRVAFVSPGGSEKGRKLAPQHLRDMRRVYKQPKSADETPAQRSLRKLMEDDFSKFMGMLQAAEKGHEAAKAARPRAAADGSSKAAAGGEVDEGTEAARVVILRCLAECGE